MSDWDLYKEHHIIEFEVECPKCGKKIKSYGDAWVPCCDCNLIYFMKVYEADTKIDKKGNKHYRIGKEIEHD